MDDGKAVRVVLRQLRVRCPACSAVVEVTESLGSALLQLAADRLEPVGDPLSELVRQALQTERARRNARNGEAQAVGEDGPSTCEEGGDRVSSRHDRLGPASNDACGEA